MQDIPIELIVDILLRLPVKPLLRFRCVSKPFCALIDSHDFIRSHLKRSIETKSHRSLLLVDYILCSTNFESLHNAVEFDHPFKSIDNPTGILGSCDGLICLFNDGEEQLLAIWNPSTRRCKKLPYTGIELPGYATGVMHAICGFGYDRVSDDYKLVRFVQFLRRDDRDSFGSVVKVYSMKSNSWRRIQDFPYYVQYRQCGGVLVGSALHWVVCRNLSETPNVVAAFDLTNEDYRLVLPPEFVDNTFHMNITELGGCLCILCTYDQVRVDAWVMKDYGVKESWNKLFSIAQPEVIWSFRFMIPLAYSKSGCEVLLQVQDTQKLVWYDLKHKTIKKIKTRGITDDFESFVCVESLVPISGRGAILDEEGETYGMDRDSKRRKNNTPNKMVKSR
ncbi:hypothetical protein Vadar_002088 [Vaccinium darrowii]|uniref:Uncharacterized protein n=1 Tax=Vaccinium darrowii TaxID=229202 RepID=A0ACB7X6W2_9ERIC|nr:hypothetical protein Vadar_002088 [Vaccinium darrowii]